MEAPNLLPGNIMADASTYNSLSLRGRTIIVTGGGSGIGQATALLVAERGASVVIADIDDKMGTYTAQAIINAGGKASSIRTDVSKESDVEAMVAHAVETFGDLHGAFNNAGLGCEGSVTELSLDQWERVISVDLTGVYLCVKHEIRQMLKSGGGSIVNNGSVSSLVALPNNVGYDSAKHGVLGVTKSASLSHSSQGVRVNAVLPGAIETPLMRKHIDARPELAAAIAGSHPIGRYGQPIEVAEAVAWLLSDAASFVTGVALPVDGGYVAI